MNFQYTSKEIDYLKAKDATLSKAIDRIGIIERSITPNMFVALVDSIVGQQISGKAATTVMNRLIERTESIEPEIIYNSDLETIQKCGMSFRKAEYIKEIAKQVHTGKLDLEALNDLNDDELCSRLVQIRGIGKWTAEMLMIFSMGRMDILSYDDLAIKRGMRMLYRHRTITEKLFDKYRRRYSPYASVASLYLWEISSGKYEEYQDPMAKSKK